MCHPCYTDFWLTYTAEVNILEYFFSQSKTRMNVEDCTLHFFVSLRWEHMHRLSFVSQVIDLGGEPIKGSDYFGNGRVTEFKYGAKLGTVIRKWNGEKMAYLK